MVIPIHDHPDHWVLAVIDLKEMQILYYDLLGGNRNAGRVMKNLALYIDDWALFNLDIDPEAVKHWPRTIVSSCPLQTDAYSCGVFVLTYAEHIGRGVPIDFPSGQIEYFRRKIIVDLYKGYVV